MAVSATGADLFVALLKTLGLDAAELPDQHDPADPDLSTLSGTPVVTSRWTIRR